MPNHFSEYIFRYAIEIVGYNLLFYWTVDHNFYVIETEKNPIEVRRICLNPNWDGKCEFQKAGLGGGPNTASPGEILARFESPTELWDNLKNNDVKIGEVISKSLIVNWD